MRSPLYVHQFPRILSRLLCVTCHPNCPRIVKRCIFSLECNKKFLLFITTSQESCRQKTQCDSFSQEHFLKATLFLLPAWNCFHTSETIALQHNMLATAMHTHKYQSNYSCSLVFFWEFKYSFYLTSARDFMTFLTRSGLNCRFECKEKSIIIFS